MKYTYKEEYFYKGFFCGILLAGTILIIINIFL